MVNDDDVFYGRIFISHQMVFGSICATIQQIVKIKEFLERERKTENNKI